MKSLVTRCKTMLKTDARRMFVQPLLYIMLGVSLMIPVLILVMTTMIGGTTIDPTTGEEVVIESFTNVWQTIGSTSGSSMSMDLTGMCNINMMYFLIAVFACLFVGADSQSGYVKNIFTIRNKKTDYVFSKTILASFAGALMVIGYFVGAMVGGGISGLSFELVDVTALQIVCCLISKVLFVPIFVSIAIVFSTLAKQKVWLSVLLSLGVGMFLFMMLSIAAPLNVSFLHIVICLVGAFGFSLGLGVVSNLILNKTDLV